MSEDRAGEQPQGAPQAAPGWYPDPEGGGNLFYWDGSGWTGEVRAARQPAAKRGKVRRPEGLVIGGGIALAISPFLTWVKVVLLGSLTLFQLFEATGRSKGLAWGAVIAGGLAAAVAFNDRKPKVVRGIGLAVGGVAGLYAIYALVGLRHDIREADGLATIGIGPYVAIAGAVAMVIGALMVKSSRSALGGQTGGGEIGSELEQLTDLHARGVLTDAEFERAKAQALKRG